MMSRTAYPMYTQNNISPSNKSLFVSHIHYHVSSPGEMSAYTCIPKIFHLGYILTGKYDLNGQTLKEGTGYLINPESKNYTLLSLTKNDSFVELCISGYIAQKFLTTCSMPLNTHIFSHPHGLEIANLIKDVACTDYEHQDIDLLLTGLLYNVMSYHKQPLLLQKNPFRPVREAANTQIPYLQVILKYIDEHYAENISVVELANMVYLTPNYLSGVFKKIYGLSLQRYIIKYRISIAEDLISNSTLSIGTIAGMVGYPDAQHFSQIFKSILGYTPSKYRELTKK